MLVTLEELKLYLGITGNAYDAFLIQQIKLISEAIEMYTNRSFSVRKFKETFYREDAGYVNLPMAQLMLYHFPVISIDSINRVYPSGSILVDQASLKIHKPTGIIRNRRDFTNLFCGDMEIIYTAGLNPMPEVIKNVIYGLVGESYNKKKNGIDLNFGSDVQSISIPGVINIAYDYTLDNNSEDNSFGIILGNYKNSLDYLRSERSILGSSHLEYIEDVI